MRSSRALRTGTSVATATFLSLVLASQAIAAAWSQPTALTSSGRAHAGGLVTLGGTHAVAAYWNKGRVVVRRSTDSGGTWRTPQRLATDAEMPSIAGNGCKVDVVWAKNGRVRYARSTNFGASFGATMALSPVNRLVTAPKVARGPNGLVIVAWGQAKRLPPADGPWNVRARVSTNGGASFGPARTLGEGRSWDGRQLAVAAGNGVAYVAWDGWQDIPVPGGIVSQDGMHVRRTVDGGATWGSSTFFAWDMYAPVLSMAAAGGSAYVAYGASSETCDANDNCTNLNWIQYRRTTNRGASWSAPRNVTQPASPGAGNPVISLTAGMVRAAFSIPVQMGPDSYGSAIYYSQSANGLAWTTSEQVTPGMSGFGLPAGVNLASRVIVLYSDNASSREGNVFVRTRSP